MIKKFPSRPLRPAGRFDLPRPAVQPGWYKRFKRLAQAANKPFRIK